MADFSLKSGPVGLRFKPTDSELVDHYLRHKINGNAEQVRNIRELELDIYNWEPWELPELAENVLLGFADLLLETDATEWIFFCPRNPHVRHRTRRTKKGFWKLMAYDRKVKKGTCVIGLKRTLNYYERCLPKPKRANWKIHEFTITLPEFEGGSHVICRLLKDDDKSIQGSQGDEVEPAVSYPTTPKSSSADMQSVFAQETPVPRMPAEQFANYEEYFDRINPSTLVVPAEFQSNGYNTYDEVPEATATEMDPQSEENMELPCRLILEPDEWAPFSPFYSHVQGEVGSSYMHEPVTDNNSNGYNGLQLQHGTNEHNPSISEFYDSVFSNSYENCLAEPGSQKSLAFVTEAPMNVMPVSHNVVSVLENTDEDRRTSSHTNAIRNRDNVGTEIRIRTCSPENQPSTLYTFYQGTASRRINLQRRLEVGKLFSCGTSQLGFSVEYHGAKSIVTEEGKAAENHTTGGTYATTLDDPPKICLPESNQEVTMDMRPKLRFKGNVPKGRGKNNGSAFLKTRLAYHSVLSSVYLVSVGVVVVMFIISACLWRCLKSHGYLENTFCVYKWP